MQFKKDILFDYMSMAPLALVFERYLECQIYQEKTFERPVLDLGCGDGLYSYILFDEEIDTGIDPNRKELDRAAELGRYSELIECMGDHISKPDGYYRTIFSNSVLEHIRDLEPVFKEINRLLTQDGRFYMTVPSSNFEQNTAINLLLMKVGLAGFAARYRKFCSVVIWKQYHYKTINEWKSILPNFGFEVVDAFTYDDRSICLLNNFFYPFGIFGKLNKHLFNRWIIFPAIRRIFIYPVYVLSKTKFKINKTTENGGLIFIELKKVKNI
jgi:SAM-dependent methyltransferase